MREKETEQIVEDFLAHYGKKGMKWGVVNDNKGSQKLESKTDTINLKKTPIEQKKYFGLSKKQALIGAGVLVGVGITMVVLKKTGNFPVKDLEKGFKQSTMTNGKARYEDLIRRHGQTSASSFPKGQMFTRMSHVAETNIRNGTYASYTPKDIASYTTGWTSQHKIQIKALGDIKTPSQKTRFDTMAELVDQHHVELNNRTLRKYLMDQQSTRAARHWVKKASSDEIGKYQYSRMTGDIWERNPIGKKFLESLKAKGYDAMIDDQDTGSLAEAAMVLINKNMFQITSNSPVVRADIDSAYSELHKLLSA